MVAYTQMTRFDSEGPFPFLHLRVKTQQQVETLSELPKHGKVNLEMMWDTFLRFYRLGTLIG